MKSINQLYLLGKVSHIKTFFLPLLYLHSSQRSFLICSSSALSFAAASSLFHFTFSPKPFFPCLLPLGSAVISQFFCFFFTSFMIFFQSLLYSSHSFILAISNLFCIVCLAFSCSSSLQTKLIFTCSQYCSLTAQKSSALAAMLRKHRYSTLTTFFKTTAGQKQHLGLVASRKSCSAVL